MLKVMKPREVATKNLPIMFDDMQRGVSKVKAYVEFDFNFFLLSALFHVLMKGQFSYQNLLK